MQGLFRLGAQEGHVPGLLLDCGQHADAGMQAVAYVQ